MATRPLELRLSSLPSAKDDSIPIVSLVELPAEHEAAIKLDLKTDDISWKEKPDIQFPGLEHISWARAEAGTNTDTYRLASEAKGKRHACIIFLDGNTIKDRSVVISRWLSKDQEELSIRRMPAQRAALALAYCNANDLSVSDAPVKRVNHRSKSLILRNPFLPPFNSTKDEE